MSIKTSYTSLLTNLLAKKHVYKRLPWKKGQRSQTPMPPTCMNCPSETSRINIGMPPNTTQIKYGIKKAPKMY